MACSRTDVLAGSTPPISKIVFFCQTLSIALKGRNIRNATLEQILTLLWHGAMDQTIASLENIDPQKVKDLAKVEEFIGYLRLSVQVDVYQFSKEMGLGKFVYVGYSMGGRVGLDLAIAHSEVLKGAVLMVPVPARMSAEPLPPTEWRNPEAIQANYESILVRRQPTEEELQLLLEDNLLVKEATWLVAADWRKMYPDVEARLGEIKAPTLMIICGRETVLLPDDQWRTVRQIPGAKAFFFEDEGHLIIPENIPRVAREMIGFIDQLP